MTHTSQMVLTFVIGILASTAFATTASDKMKNVVATIGEEAFVSPKYNTGLLRHIVLFRYQDNTTAQQKQEITRRFLNLKKECVRNGSSYIVSIETGLQNSGEGVDQELEQAFIVTFQSEGDRNYYVGRDIVQKDGNFDVAHDNFKKFVGPFLHEPISPTGVLVFDFNVLSCNVTNCAACNETDNSQCVTCNASFYVNATDNKTCAACSNGCNSCSDANNCKTCDDAFYLNGSSCRACMAGCSKCGSNDICSACMGNLTFNTVKKVCSGFRVTFIYGGIIFATIIAFFM